MIVLMKGSYLKTLFALFGCAAAPACSGGSVNIGNTNAVGSRLSDYAASWDGYAEAAGFLPSGSDRVRLTLDQAGHGTLQVGDGPMVAPPTDPSVGYPPGISADDALGLVEGFQYPVYAAQIQASRIQLGINPTDLFAQWCAIQTSYPWAAGDAGTTYTCVQNYSATVTGSVDAGNLACQYVTFDGSSVGPVDCGKETLCVLERGRVCSCAATGCTNAQVVPGTPANEYATELDVALDGPGRSLTGTLLVGQGPPGGRIAIHLTRP